MGKGSASKGSRACGLPCEGLAGARRAVRGADARWPRPAPWTGTLTAGHLALLGFAVAAVVSGLEALVLHHRGHGRRQGRAGRPRLSAARGRPGESAGARRGEDWGARPGRCAPALRPRPGAAPRVPSVLGPSRTLAGDVSVGGGYETRSLRLLHRRSFPPLRVVSRLLQIRKLRHGGCNHSKLFPGGLSLFPSQAVADHPVASSSFFQTSKHSVKYTCRHPVNGSGS